MTKYFTAAMMLESQEQDIGEYLLPCDPSITIRVKRVSVARYKQFQEASAKGGPVERRAQAALIADSVVDEAGMPVFTADGLYNDLGKMSMRWFLSLQRVVSTHNGGDDEVKQAEANETAVKN